MSHPARRTWHVSTSARHARQHVMHVMHVMHVSTSARHARHARHARQHVMHVMHVSTSCTSPSPIFPCLFARAPAVEIGPLAGLDEAGPVEGVLTSWALEH